MSLRPGAISNMNLAKKQLNLLYLTFKNLIMMNDTQDTDAVERERERERQREGQTERERERDRQKMDK